ncbi:hypothetical protein L6452_40229 [Arctium lappa]|uniref:Uncharacterized protein n=1 Tax=Arctium lappa TaxID=4217 RepID=A0ACB8XLX6_ARCLA|nr:hypothetical protein L6452_40229 [Arctium lappa]
MEEGGVGKNTGNPMVSSSSRGVNYSGPQGLTRRSSRNAATTTFSMEVFDNEVVPSSLQQISPILRVATEIQQDRPRVAYLCRLYAFEKANRLDQNSSGRGVRQFKTSLLQRLERDDGPSVAARVKKTDAREIESFYKQYYEQYVKALDQGEKADRAQLGKAYQVAGVLFEVLCSVNKSEKAEEVPADVSSLLHIIISWLGIIASARDVEAKQVIYAPYNILPLDSAGESQCIMQFEEIKAPVSALRNIRGLNWPTSVDQHQQKSGELDLLDWLKAMFGFQAYNVRNQREHLILQLAHPQARLMPKPEPSNKACTSCLLKPVLCRLPQGGEEMQQRKLLYMGLYLLIWGEAANIMIIIAWSDVSISGILDVVLNFPGYHRWKFTAVLRNILKIITSLAWSIILPLCYVHQNDNISIPFQKARDILSFLNKFDGIPSLYLMAVALYLLPNLIAAVLFIFPMLRRWIENSDWLIARFLLWWSQVQTFAHSPHY